MRKQLFFIFLVFLLGMSARIVSAQSTNLVFFTEGGERFYLVLNGIRQNASPETNVQITHLPAPSYKVRIMFEDPKLKQLDKTVLFTQGTETTFCIRKNNKGEFVIRFMDQVDIEQAPPPPPTQKIFVFTTVPAVTTTTVTQTTNTTVSGNVSAPGMDMNVMISDDGSNGSVQTSSTTVTTTTSTQGGEIHQEVEGDHDHGAAHHSKPPYVMPGYNGPVGCPYPMTDLDFQDVKQTIESKSFEDSKLTIAKEVISATCMFASEVREIMELFSFENTRLEFAKFAYRYTFDLGNYYKVNAAFQFESSIDDLKKYIQANRK
ncbi:MAG: DUF4476 domain-containing protein [Bacteroidetes bacterium]|nr:DUF4476 domain-containing protein [Bacteroidota bacterium]